MSDSMVIPTVKAEKPFRVEIPRRSAERGKLRRISGALGADHDRLAQLEVAAFVARAAGDAKAAERRYAAFSSGLKHHIAVEEELLFPVFEKRVGLSPSAGPTEVLRREHEEILRLLGEILRTIGNPAKLPDEARAAFHEVLEKHHLKEEEILYPALDYALSPGESDALLAKIQEFDA
jgi:iron-sulfur cluster repair protein YtfE (RIC family)